MQTCTEHRYTGTFKLILGSGVGLALMIDEGMK